MALGLPNFLSAIAGSFFAAGFGVVVCFLTGVSFLGATGLGNATCCVEEEDLAGAFDCACTLGTGGLGAATVLTINFFRSFL